MSVDRFGTLLYGIGEAAGYLAIPPSTLTTWAYGYERRRAGTGHKGPADRDSCSGRNAPGTLPFRSSGWQRPTHSLRSGTPGPDAADPPSY